LTIRDDFPFEKLPEDTQILFANLVRGYSTLEENCHICTAHSSFPFFVLKELEVKQSKPNNKIIQNCLFFP
jgi:hypothetical protein